MAKFACGADHVTLTASSCEDSPKRGTQNSISRGSRKSLHQEMWRVLAGRKNVVGAADFRVTLVRDS